MKQKIVIKVCAHCDKCRSKALKKAAKADGVISVALEGEDKVVVVGEGVDAARLTDCLRKKLTYACIISVEEVKPPKPQPQPQPQPTQQPKCCNEAPRCELHTTVVYDPDPAPCTIM